MVLRLEDTDSWAPLPSLLIQWVSVGFERSVSTRSQVKLTLMWLVGDHTMRTASLGELK